jgi:hypothetical protein
MPMSDDAYNELHVPAPQGEEFLRAGLDRNGELVVSIDPGPLRQDVRLWGCALADIAEAAAKAHALNQTLARSDRAMLSSDEEKALIDRSLKIILEQLVSEPCASPFVALASHVGRLTAGREADGESIVNFDREVCRLVAECDSLRAEVVRLTEDSEEHEAEVERERNGRDDAYAEVKRLTEDLAEMDKERNEARTEVDRLTTALADAEEAMGVAGARADRAEDLARLHGARLAALDGLTGALSTAEAEHDEALARLAAAESERDGARWLAERLHAAMIGVADFETNDAAEIKMTLRVNALRSPPTWKTRAPVEWTPEWPTEPGLYFAVWDDERPRPINVGPWYVGCDRPTAWYATVGDTVMFTKGGKGGPSQGLLWGPRIPEPEPPHTKDGDR